jgi:hypothetical protein
VHVYLWKDYNYFHNDLGPKLWEKTKLNRDEARATRKNQANVISNKPSDRKRKLSPAKRVVAVVAKKKKKNQSSKPPTAKKPAAKNKPVAKTEAKKPAAKRSSFQFGKH